MAQPNSCTPRRVPGTTPPSSAATTAASTPVGTAATNSAVAIRAAAGFAVTGAAAIAGLAYLGAGLLTRVEVVGMSMAPALLPGDRLLVLRWPRVVAPWPLPGDVVALRDPRRPARVLVKRVGTVNRHTGMLEVLGDEASASTDSRTFGPVPRSLVMGKAIYRYAPHGRVGGGPWPLGLRFF
jgi:nickel-type superoxide dismutase maturation protease